jgi:hypothetical protein
MAATIKLLSPTDKTRTAPTFTAMPSLEMVAAMVALVSQDFLFGILFILVPSLLLCAFLVWRATR